MTSYRTMRLQARQIRRTGMQPVMVISSGGEPPETAGVLLRWAWRYRSELAPLYLVAVILGASWWLHAAHARWWELILSAAERAVNARKAG